MDEQKKIDKAKKAAQILDADLTGKQQKTLVKSHQESEIQKRVNKIRINADLYKTAQIDIIKDLMYLQNHQDELKAELNITFKEFIESLGMSKTDFYRQIGNYKYLEEHKKTELVESVDSEIIRLISQADPEKQEELLNRAGELTRDDFKQSKKTESHRGTVKVIEAEIIKPEKGLFTSQVEFNPGNAFKQPEPKRVIDSEFRLYLIEQIDKEENKITKYEAGDFKRNKALIRRTAFNEALIMLNKIEGK